MMHPDISMMNGRERRKQMLAVAARQRLARQVRDADRAARRARRMTVRGSRVRGFRGLSRILLKEVR